MVAGSKKVVADAVMNDKNTKPAPDPVKAPNGWAWDRSTGNWRPAKKRGNYTRAKVDPVTENVSEAVSDAGDEGPARQRDPDPAWFSDNTGGRKRKLTIADVPKETVNDLAGFMGLIGTPVLAMLQSVDPYCGGALMQSFEDVVNATLPLMCRSQKIVDYFAGDKSDWLLWGKLGIALMPVGRAVIDHHVLRRVEVVRDEMGIPHVRESRRGGGEHGEHLTPPVQPEFDSSAYAA